MATIIDRKICDYVIIGCGYTCRLVENVEEIQEKSSNSLIFLDNKYYGSKNDETILRVSEIDLFGTVVFKASTLTESFKLAWILKGFDHCGGFDHPHSGEFRELEIGDKKVTFLILEYDTESG